MRGIARGTAIDIHTMQDHYARLGVHCNATMAEIKQAFRRQAALHHPDRNPSPDAATRFRAVQQSYEVLSDPERRKAYDDLRQRKLLDDPLPVAASLWRDYVRDLRRSFTSTTLPPSL
ncbi:J domain-containing protein [Candidatus Symbiobacter mobilis]